MPILRPRGGPWHARAVLARSLGPVNPPASAARRLARLLAGSLVVAGLAAPLAPALALPARAASIRAVGATRHIVDKVNGFSFDLPTVLSPVPSALLKGRAGRNVKFFAIRSRRNGVVVEDVIVAVYPGRLLLSVAVFRSLLGASRNPVDISSAKVSFGRVLKGTVSVVLSSGARVHSVAYLFHRGARTYAVAFNGLSSTYNAQVAAVVMGSWGR